MTLDEACAAAAFMEAMDWQVGVEPWAGGDGSVATGTSSSSDWKQITA